MGLKHSPFMSVQRAVQLSPLGDFLVGVQGGGHEVVRQGGEEGVQGVFWGSVRGDGEEVVRGDMRGGVVEDVSPLSWGCGEAVGDPPALGQQAHQDEEEETEHLEGATSVDM